MVTEAGKDVEKGGMSSAGQTWAWVGTGKKSSGEDGQGQKKNEKGETSQNLYCSVR